MLRSDRIKRKNRAAPLLKKWQAEITDEMLTAPPKESYTPNIDKKRADLKLSLELGLDLLNPDDVYEAIKAQAIDGLSVEVAKSLKLAAKDKLLGRNTHVFELYSHWANTGALDKTIELSYWD